jgi:rhodanese-related sulfurtransferase
MSKGLKDLMADAAGRVQSVTAQEMKERQDRGEVDLVIDVRDAREFEEGHLPGAVNISRGLLEIRAAADSPGADPAIAANQDARIVTYCTKAPGARALLAAGTLAELGYTNVVVLRGGLNEWAEQGFAVD